MHFDISDINLLGDISDNGGNINEEIYTQLDPANGFRFTGEYLSTQFYKGGLNGQFSYNFGFTDDRDSKGELHPTTQTPPAGASARTNTTDGFHAKPRPDFAGRVFARQASINIIVFEPDYHVQGTFFLFERDTRQ
jgi:hypothetical protein